MIPYRVKYQVPNRRYIWTQTLNYHRGLAVYTSAMQCYDVRDNDVISVSWNSEKDNKRLVPIDCKSSLGL